MTTHQDDRGVPRQDHYGSDRQPWDDYVDEGWAPEVCAAMVLKYLRRDKEPEHSLESAQWYWARLHELMRGELLPKQVGRSHGPNHAIARAAAVLIRLRELLTDEERRRITG